MSFINHWAAGEERVGQGVATVVLQKSKIRIHSDDVGGSGRKACAGGVLD
jgi:hypothetical protein